MWLVQQMFDVAQVPTSRFVMQSITEHTRDATDFASKFAAPCACVGPGNEHAPDWWLVLSLTVPFKEQREVVTAGRR